MAVAVAKATGLHVCNLHVFAAISAGAISTSVYCVQCLLRRCPEGRGKRWLLDPCMQTLLDWTPMMTNPTYMLRMRLRLLLPLLLPLQLQLLSLLATSRAPHQLPKLHHQSRVQWWRRPLPARQGQHGTHQGQCCMSQQQLITVLQGHRYRWCTWQRAPQSGRVGRRHQHHQQERRR